MQITLTLDLTPETLTLLHNLLAVQSGEKPAPAPAPVEAPKKEKKPAPAPAPKPAAAPPPPVPEPEAPAEEAQPASEIDPADLRVLIRKFSSAGKQTVVKAIFAKYGANKLSDVPQDKYAELKEDLEDANG